MKTRSLNQAKSSLGHVTDDAQQGPRTAIIRDGKLPAAEFDALIDEGVSGKHIFLTGTFWAGVKRRGGKVAK